MKKNNFLFWLLLVVAVVVVDRVVGLVFSDFYQKQTHGIIGKLNYLSTECKDEILIMGSSKAEHAYRSVILDTLLGKSVYNAGFAGKIISFHDALLHLILSHHTPEIIVLDVTDKDLWDLGKNEAFEELYSLTPFYGQSPVVDSLLVSGSVVERVKLQSHAYPYNSALTNLLKTSDKLERGFKDHNKEWKDPLEVNSRNYIQLDATRLTFLRDFMMTCKKRDIRLICIISPVYMLSDGREFEPLRVLCLEWGVELLDFYQQEDFLNNQAYFADETHLNTSGASHFSKMVAKNL